MGKKLFAWIGCLLIPACASTWTLVSEKNDHVQLDQISLNIPSGWMLYNNHDNNYTAIINGRRIDQKVQRVVITRNGLNLDFIDILEFDGNNAFPSLEKSADTTALPSELAELLIAEQKTKLGMDSIQIVKNEPVMIAGRKGFLVRLRFKNKSGLQIEQLIYGFVMKDKFYTFKFRAPSLHYFGAGLPDFENLIASVTLNI
ncbi:MAG: hypothetical protein PVJ72_11875 [Gammaproteobacteria bacterium]|jgi:hypothetical protein